MPKTTTNASRHVCKPRQRLCFSIEFDGTFRHSSNLPVVILGLLRATTSRDSHPSVNWRPPLSDLTVRLPPLPSICKLTNSLSDFCICDGTLISFVSVFQKTNSTPSAFDVMTSLTTQIEIGPSEENKLRVGCTTFQGLLRNVFAKPKGMETLGTHTKPIRKLVLFK